MIELTPLTRDDLPLLLAWRRREDVKRCWHGRAGREATDHYQIVLDGTPIGLIQSYPASDYPDWERLIDAGEGVAGVDLLIAEELTGRGLGPRVLAAFTREVAFVQPGTTACVATVEETSRRSWRAFEKAGFRHVRDVEEDGIPHRLMRLDRPGWRA